MANLDKCSACGQTVSAQAAACPACGQPTPRQARIRGNLILAAVLLVVVVAAVLMLRANNRDMERYSDCVAAGNFGC